MSSESKTTTPRKKSRMHALDRAREQGLFSSLDVQFATRLCAICQETSEEVLWALALVCRQEAQGHVCADLAGLEARGLVVELDGNSRSFSALPENITLDQWLQLLRESRVVGVDLENETSEEAKPLILDSFGRLYLRRSYLDQTRLAVEISRRGRAPDLSNDWSRIEEGMDRLLPARIAGEIGPDWTRVAIRTGLARPLSIITGGPGTGKTTLVVRLISLAIEERFSQGLVPPTIRLLAPTGKAAAAMTSSFQRQRERLAIAPEVRSALPISAETIHRALLRERRQDAFGREEMRPLNADIVVVDEASMIDLAQMRELFSACQNVGRLVLLGDPNQLASVDSGAALAEICSIAAPMADDSVAPNFAARAIAAEPEPARLVDSIVTLRESYRFASGGSIGLLAEAIRMGDADLTLSLLGDPKYADIERCDVDSIEDVQTRLIEGVRELQEEIQSAGTPGEKIEQLNSRRVLCAHRGGPLGVDSLSEVLDDAAAMIRVTSNRAQWWAGKLLLVKHNSPGQDLWNGDVGLVEDTPLGLRAIFPDAQGGVRVLAAGGVPTCESAIAMSVHKSQGSEYDVVDLVLGRSSSRVMTRELLYTGVTRARKRLYIYASEEVIREAVARKIERDSGLAELLEVTGS